MQKFHIIKYQTFLIAVSITLFIYLLGVEFISPQNQDWLYSGDLSVYQIGWKYFRNDIWRFPLGLNPNFGIYAGGSIVFSDSIPILSIFFKLIKSYLPTNFQYFSIWILLCIYLQLFFSFKLVYKLTNNLIYSLISSLFFCFATIFINRSAIHLSLTAQWLILFAFYIEILDTKYKSLLRGFNIVLSCTIHFYFTIILIIFNLLINLFRFFKEKINLIKILKEILFIYSFLLIIMYVVGYFSIDPQDGLGGGFGYFNSNLNSFFNPTGSNNFENFNWSLFFPLQDRITGEHEGFAFLGITGCIFLFLFFINFFFKKYETIFTNSKILIICLPFFVLAISNNINLGEQNLIYISLNKFLYAILSSVRASGRLIWPIYYLIFIFGIIFVYKYFNKKKSTFIILFLLILQIIDIYPGLTQYKFGSQYISTKNNLYINDKIWKNLSNQFEQIRLIEPKNSSGIYWKMQKYLLEEDFIKTDVFYLGRVNRKAIALKKYELIELFNRKNLDVFQNTLFVSEDKNLVKNIYNLYKNELYYYFRDEIWLISSQPILGHNSDVDLRILSTHYEFDLNKKNQLVLDNKNNSLRGMGWVVQKNIKGLISDGFYSTVFFKIRGSDCKKNSKIKLDLNKYFIDYKEPIKIKLFLNKIEKETIFLNKDINSQANLTFDCNEDEIVVVNFKIENPISLYDLRKGLNRNKRSIILNSISIND